MTSSITRDAHAVLFPAFDSYAIEPWLSQLLESGTLAVIVGESREEYVNRRMSAARQAHETVSVITELTASLRTIAGGDILIAVDQEPWGIARLHKLVPATPLADEWSELGDDSIRGIGVAVATEAFGMGINAFLSPVLDKLTGPNPWLRGRTLDLSLSEIARIASAFVEGVQSASVAAIAKHYPGFPNLKSDPALTEALISDGDWDEKYLIPFDRVVQVGARAMMVGPAIVSPVDREEAATTSASTILRLRQQSGFTGVVVSDDLDAPATSRGRTVIETALASLRAGADLLLLPGGPEVEELALAIAGEATRDADFAERIRDAAKSVRELLAIVSADR